MAVNRVDFGGNTLIDLTGDTLESAEQLLKGIIAHAKDGSVIEGMLEAGGGNFSVETGSITFAESYKPNSTPLVISHSLGKTPIAFIAYNGSQGSYPAYQIAFLYKLRIYFGSSRWMRSTYSTIMYATKAGNKDIYSTSSENTITLSPDKITISGTTSAPDFNPDTSGNYTSTLVWFAIAEN